MFSIRRHPSLAHVAVPARKLHKNPGSFLGEGAMDVKLFMGMLMVRLVSVTAYGHGGGGHAGHSSSGYRSVGVVEVVEVVVAVTTVTTAMTTTGGVLFEPGLIACLQA